MKDNHRVALTNIETGHVAHPEAVKGGIIAVLISMARPTTSQGQTYSDLGQKLQYELTQANN
jgi:hypothetical protein